MLCAQRLLLAENFMLRVTVADKRPALISADDSSRRV